MEQVSIHRDFESWRGASRRLLARQVTPENVLWLDDSQTPLLPLTTVNLEGAGVGGGVAGGGVVGGVRVPREFVELAETVACHRSPQRWPLLYRMLWRLTHGLSDLLDHLADDDVREADQMAKAVSRDRHKMTAFVRFRRVTDAFGEHYIAFHRPDHFIVKLAAPFFQERFAAMRWTILTPDDSVSWDGHDLCFFEGMPASSAPPADATEDLWQTYYANIFNPARIKLNAMRKEMPVRHWKTLPETRLIPDLLREAPRRVEQMVRYSKTIAAPAANVPPVAVDCEHATSAAEFLPAKIALPQLKAAATSCRGCAIHCNATQTVFGDGPAHAKIMFVGEQPGDQEDRQGKPFVGPAGQLLDEVLIDVGIPRDQAYVTNAVKHFKWEPRGKRRLHATPSAREVTACKPWLMAEIEAIKPQLIVALGATAARSLFGNQFRVLKQRGQPIESPLAPVCIATIHPSAILRTPDDQRASALEDFKADLRVVAGWLKRL